jgi:hypothetical protein
VDDSDLRRRRIAWGLLLVGCALVFTGAGVILRHRYQLETPEAASRLEATPDAKRMVAALRQLTFLLVVLVCVLGVSLLAFRRWSRGFRQRLLRKSPAPTPSEDVWAMHRLSEEPAYGSEDPPPSAGPGT